MYSDGAQEMPQGGHREELREREREFVVMRWAGGTFPQAENKKKKQIWGKSGD